MNALLDAICILETTCAYLPLVLVSVGIYLLGSRHGSLIEFGRFGADIAKMYSEVQDLRLSQNGLLEERETLLAENAKLREKLEERGLLWKDHANGNTNS